jgi:hypothetical protein
MEKRVSVNLRLPPEVHADLKRIADEEERSLTGQIVRFLRSAIERYDAERPEPEARS